MNSDPGNDPALPKQPLLAPLPLLRRRDRFDSYEQAARIARRRLPRSIYSELVGAPDRAVTLQANVAAFDEVLFRPRAAVATAGRTISTTVLGVPISLPVLIAPVGGLRIVHPDGAPAAVAAAGDAGTIAAVSGSAGHPIADIASVASGPLWQQFYISRGRERAEILIAQAKERGCAALVVTVDAAVQGNRRPALRINLRNAFEFAPELILRPGWTRRFVRDGLQIQVANDAVGTASSDARPKMTAEWSDFAWIRELWQGPLVVKGIVRPEDALRALDVGADAVVVSNHGGLTLDGTVATLSVLPSIVAAIDGRAEVLVDGGVRQGTDVVKAIALGARAVLIGRAYVLGLAIAGKAGVRTVLENLRYEIDRTLGLLGLQSIADVDRSCVDVTSTSR